MSSWIQRISHASGAEAASPTRAQTLPSTSEGRKDEPKRRSFFTMGKKKWAASQQQPPNQLQN